MGCDVKTYVYPAGLDGCAYFRLIWPAQALARQGHDVRVVMPKERDTPGLSLQGVVRGGSELIDVMLPTDADVLVFQRPTHIFLSQAMKFIHAKGVAVVVDMDDDLGAIHPSNPSFMALHPRNVESTEHSWRFAQRACEGATLVTTSTPALAQRYAPHGRSQVIYNHLHDRYPHIPHTDSAVFGWGGSLHSHPDDLQVIGFAAQRLQAEGATFRVAGPPTGIAKAIGLDELKMQSTGPVDIARWPHALSTLGVGMAPLSDTRFNAAKSWLKPLEYAGVGVPCVFSPRVEYTRLHTLHDIGLPADKPRDWYRQLKRLIDNPALRQELSAKGREAARELTIERNAWRWAEAWDRAYRIVRGDS